MIRAILAGGLLLGLLLALGGLPPQTIGEPPIAAPAVEPPAAARAAEPAEVAAADRGTDGAAEEPTEEPADQPADEPAEPPPANEIAAEPADTADAGPMPWETPSGGGKPAEMVLVEDPRYNEKDPVLFDSGYEEDNASCMVCHIDFEREELSMVHLDAAVTCAACHGDSEVHRSDEFNVIRPDVIWGRAEIEPFCKQCHPKHKDPEKVDAFLAEWEGKRRENGRWVLRGSVCTDCHGKHAIVTGEGAFK